MGNIFLDKEGAKVFILKNCWNRFLVRNLLSAKPATVNEIVLENQLTARLKILQLTVRKSC